jgi:hypothetical protein
MYNDRFRISLRAANGNYYSAVQATDNTWTVTNSGGAAYLKHLPKGWDETDITWERNMTYYGVFRSQTQKFQFSEDARAILLSILADKGVNGYCRMTIDIYNESTLLFETFYTSQIDLSGAKDSKRTQLMVVATLDSELYELLKSKAQSEFNIPFWVYSSGSWLVNASAVFLQHTGIKLRWQTQYVSAATATSPLNPPVAFFPFGVFGVQGWNRGSVSDGRHWIPTLNKFNVAQANGTTTFIGNDILEVVLPAYNQPSNYNRNFNGADDIQAYTKNQCLVKNLIDNSAGSVSLAVRVFGTFGGTFTYSTNPQDQYLRIVLFEIDQNDEPVTIPGPNYQYTTLFSLLLPNGGGPYTPPSMDFDTTTIISLPFRKAGIIGIIYDGVTSGLDTTHPCVGWWFEQLEAVVFSNYNSGTSTPVDAPIFPESTIIGFRPHRLLQEIVDCLDSTTTDAYGFPVQTGSGYIGESEYLADQTLSLSDNIDLIPYRTIETSENAVRGIIGFPYMTKSLAAFYQQWSKICGLGLGIIGDDKIKIEPYEYFFDAATLILDLGSNVADFEIMPFTEGMGNVLNAGYEPLQTNKNFAVDGFCMPMKWELPLNKTPKSLDYQVNEVNTDIYYIEKARAQNNSENSSPSASNGSVLIQITEDVVAFPDITNPAGVVVGVSAYGLDQYPTAQSTSDTTSPYIKGMYYPDTAYNLGLDPASNIYRNSKMIRSLCDGQDDFGSVMSFRKIYQQQYNDPTTPALERAGMSKYLNYGTVINQVEDIPLTTTSKLFRPYIFQVTSEYPVNMYSIINANPYGYVSFKWRGEDFTDTEYKGFLLEVKQSAANNKATVFKLLAHPSTTDADLKKN